MTATLAIVTCGPQLEVALLRADRGPASIVRLAGISPRSTLLLAAVDLVVEDAGLAATELESVVVSRGPGSFTGIRAGLATAAGLQAGSGVALTAYDSLRMQAARLAPGTDAWAAQPGRRGEVYAQRFERSAVGPPAARGGIEIVPVADAHTRGPWIAAQALDLGAAKRAIAEVGCAEGLLRLAAWDVTGDPAEPLYVEGPPIHGSSGP